MSLCHNCSFVSRGHLSPRADFIFEEWQDATFLYINAVPQFQKFNAGNWASMEEKVRDLASKLKRNLLIQTGTFAFAKSGVNSQNLHLGNKSNEMPVPLFLWKVVHDPVSNAAIVFVSLNFYTEPSQSLCPQNESNLCENSRWDFPKRNRISKGKLYCCTYQSLKEKIPWIKQYYPKEPTGILHNQ